MQASGRLVKYEQGVFLAVAASEEGGQLDALGFPAAQGVAALSEGHITQSDIEEGLELGEEALLHSAGLFLFG